MKKYFFSRHKPKNESLFYRDNFNRVAIYLILMFGPPEGSVIPEVTAFFGA